MALHQLFFYLTILLLPTQLGLHFWPDWALILGRRIDYLSPTIFLTDITILITLLLWIGSPHKITKKQILFFLGSCIYILCNIYFSPSPMIVFFRWIKVIEFSLLGYYIIYTKPSLQKTIFFLSIAMIYSSFIAISQFILQHSIGNTLWYLGERSFDQSTAGIAKVNWCWFTPNRCIELLRPYGTFPHPNVLAGFLIISICMILYHKKNSVLHNSALVISVIALVLTFSRGIWLIGIIGIITILGLRFKKTIPQILLFIILTCFICISIAFPYFYALFNNNESVILRSELSIAAIEMWKSYPLIGVGLNAFLTQLPTYLSSRYIYFLQPPHSIYLLLLSELGIVGISFIGWLLYKLITKLLLLPNKIPLVILLVFGLLGSFDHFLITLQQGQLLTTIILTLGFLSQ